MGTLRLLNLYTFVSICRLFFFFFFGTMKWLTFEIDGNLGFPLLAVGAQSLVDVSAPDTECLLFYETS